MNYSIARTLSLDSMLLLSSLRALSSLCSDNTCSNACRILYGILGTGFDALTTTQPISAKARTTRRCGTGALAWDLGSTGRSASRRKPNRKPLLLNPNRPTSIVTLSYLWPSAESIHKIDCYPANHPLETGTLPSTYQHISEQHLH